MIYLHCGWVKTGTTSLQAALVANQERLAGAGLLYPERWRRDVDGSHNDLTDLLQAHHERAAGFDELDSFLAANECGDILFSSEILTQWLWLGDRKYECVLDLVAAMREMAPVRCIWTLRRFDDVLHSMCRQMAMRRGLGARKLTRLLDALRIDELFSRMRGMENADGGDSVYVSYDPYGGHNAELLRAFGVPEDVVRAIGRELGAAPRLNITPSHKQVVAAENVAAISARSEVELTRDAMRRAFEQEGFQFHDDRPCVLFDQELRLSLQETMLESARECGVMSYVRFFGDEKLDNPLPVSRLEPDVLTDEDVGRLVTHLQGVAAHASNAT